MEKIEQWLFNGVKAKFKGKVDWPSKKSLSPLASHFPPQKIHLFSIYLFRANEQSSAAKRSEKIKEQNEIVPFFLLSLFVFQTRGHC